MIVEIVIEYQYIKDKIIRLFKADVKLLHSTFADVK